MGKFIRSAVLAATVLGSASGALVAVPASATSVQLATCIYNCGKGDGNGGVPADPYAACKATCEEIFGH